MISYDHSQLLVHKYNDKIIFITINRRKLGPEVDTQILINSHNYPYKKAKSKVFNLLKLKFY